MQWHFFFCIHGRGGLRLGKFYCLYLCPFVNAFNHVAAAHTSTQQHFSTSTVHTSISPPLFPHQQSLALFLCSNWKKLREREIKVSYSIQYKEIKVSYTIQNKEIIKLKVIVFKTNKLKLVILFKTKKLNWCLVDVYATRQG